MCSGGHGSDISPRCVFPYGIFIHIHFKKKVNAMRREKSHKAGGILSERDSFSIIYRHGKVMHDKAMRQFGLSGQQMGYLRFIHENPGVSQEELVRKVKIDKGAVAKSIRDMVDKGYVIRTQNPEDRRAYCLYLADKAENICEEGRRHGAEFERRLTEGLTEEEIETFKILLEKITRNMEKIMEGGEI